MGFLIISLACLFVHAIPEVFTIEKFEGNAFENFNVFNDIDIIKPYRLPTTTKPSHYTVLWVVDIDALTFSGTVSIELYATQANVSQIVIHAQDLKITALTLQLGNTVEPQTFTLDPEYHFLRVNLTNGVLDYNVNNPVLYTFSISFNADLRDDMQGIYKSWFKNVLNDQLHWMASTKFQATAARLAFPCYDEPNFKATFDITIRRPAAYKSWFCTRISETRESIFTGYQEDVYSRTPVMSTYLLAFIVAEYDSLELNDNGVLMFEVIARPGAISAGQGNYAFEIGQKLLAEMSNYTDYDYYSQNANLKMTQAAIPDFGAGAMENWGLLTYRETYMLSDEHTNSFYKQVITSTLSHEIAHMWFGNLVTCAWWDVLWLNEGFAGYYQYQLAHWDAEYMGFETRFITEQIHTALLSDSAYSSHSLTNLGVGSPASVSAMFSTLTYSKGAAVIRMIKHLLGFDVHRAGLRTYLSERRFGTALPIHLFETLERVGNANGAFSEYGTDFSFTEFGRSWTEQAGYPLLDVEVKHQTGEMIIYQRQFKIDKGYPSVHRTWIVPITYATASNPDFNNTKPKHIISRTVTSINRGSVGDEWVILNNQQSGFYRVNYDGYTWNLIATALRSENRTQIHEYNRAQIVDDVFQLARSGLISYRRALNLVNFLEFETEYAPWVAAMTGFTWIRNRFAGTAFLNEINNLIATWATRVMTELTYYPIAGETFMRSYLRYQLAPVMCDIGVAACRTAATNQFRALVDNNIEVPVDSRNWVYCNGLRDGTTADFNYLWTRFQQHSMNIEKIQLFTVLGCTPHKTSLTTFLNAIVREKYVFHSQDYITVFNSAVTGNEGNTQIVFTYIQNNLQAVIDVFGSATKPLSYISARLRSEAEVIEFQTWAAQVNTTLGTTFEDVYNGADVSRSMMIWSAKVQSDINSYIQNGAQDFTQTTAAPSDSAAVNFASPLALAIAVNIVFKFFTLCN